MKILKLTGLFLATALIASAAEGAATVVVQEALWVRVVAAVMAVVLAAKAIVKLTPTPKDDTVVDKIIEFLKHVGLSTPHKE